MKKIITVLIALTMIFTLTACGGSKQAAEPAPAAGSAAPAPVQSAPAQSSPAPSQSTPEPAASTPAPAPAPAPAAPSSRMAAFVDKYIVDGEFGMGIDFEGEQVYVAVKGKKGYVSMDAEGETMVIVINENGCYMLFPSEKMGISVDTDEAGIEEFTEAFDEFDRDAPFTTGDMQVEGKSYYYEEYIEKSEDGTEFPVRYCFDGDQLVYVISKDPQDKEEVMKLYSFDDDVDDSFFEIPSDYELMSF